MNQLPITFLNRVGSPSAGYAVRRAREADPPLRLSLAS
jgi:hypothetical protein